MPCIALVHSLGEVILLQGNGANFGSMHAHWLCQKWKFLSKWCLWFSSKFNCVVCFIVVFVCLLSELGALPELPWVAMIMLPWLKISKSGCQREPKTGQARILQTEKVAKRDQPLSSMHAQCRPTTRTPHVCEQKVRPSSNIITPLRIKFIFPQNPSVCTDVTSGQWPH